MRIKQVPISEIKERENSQRKGHRGIDELVDSIKRVGLLHPITLAADHTLIIGGNRLEACTRLGWKKIPAVYKDDLDLTEQRVIELEENVRRSDLTWQEFSRALRNLKNVLEDVHKDWKADKIAAYLGYDKDYLYRICRVADALDAKHINVVNASNLTAAVNVLEREAKRRIADETNEMFAAITSTSVVDLDEEGDEDEDDEAKPKAKLPKTKSKPVEEVINGDFIEWAASYTGPKFNLMHCDFPYGINHSKSGQGGAATWGAYEDDPDVYWHLLRAFAEHRDTFLYPSAHIIFWFSMRFYSETIEFFSQEMPEMEVDHQPLIWHKTDNKGIIRDAKHTPRNITETALFITRGGREIIKSVGNCYGAPTQKSKATHISEKPVPVLRHFLQLCCDGYSEVLDPTCGGGSALRAAESMGARRVLGVELNQEYADDARNQLKEHRGMANLSKQLED